jgi:hypothetical protein
MTGKVKLTADRRKYDADYRARTVEQRKRYQRRYYLSVTKPKLKAQRKAKWW